MLMSLKICKMTQSVTSRRRVQPTCNLPSRVLCIVTHFVGWAPFVVIAVIKLSSSSRFSLSFFTKLSIARFEKDSLSPPWRWHIKLWTILRQASAEVGVCVDIVKGSVLCPAPSTVIYALIRAERCLVVKATLHCDICPLRGDRSFAMKLSLHCCICP